MDCNTEDTVRLYICEKLNSKTKSSKTLFYDRYIKIKEINFSDKKSFVLLMKAV